MTLMWRAGLAAAGMAILCAQAAQGGDDDWKRRVITPQSGVIQPLPAKAKPDPTTPPASTPGTGRSGEVHQGAPLSVIIRPNQSWLLLPAPMRAHTTVDLRDCTAHGGLGGGFACQGLLPGGRVALAWDWNSKMQITGYHIYSNGVFYGKRLIGIQDKGAPVTLFILPAQYSTAGSCFIVTAFNASSESGDSNTVCIGDGSFVHAVTFKPQYIRTYFRETFRETGVVAPDKKSDEGPEPELDVGYGYDTDKQALGDFSSDIILRSALYFDLSSLNGKHIRTAHLGLRVDQTQLSGSGLWEPNLDHAISCVGRIGYGTAYWWNYNDWIDANMALAPGSMQGPDVTYDVAPLVTSWANGQPNFGMVLMGDEENLNAFAEKACITRYFSDKVVLSVEYSD